MLPLFSLPLLLAVAARPVVDPPAVLSDPDPGMIVRWKTAPAVAGRHASPGHPVVVRAGAPALLRVRSSAPSRPACRLVIRRRFGDGPTIARVILPATTTDGDQVVTVAPGVIDVHRSGDELPQSTFDIEPPAGCPPAEVDTFVAALEDDDGSALRLVESTQALRAQAIDDETLERWLTIAQPHRWQQDVARALGLGRLLAATGASTEAVAALVDAWLDEALRDAPDGAAKYCWHHPIDGGTAGRRVGDDRAPSFLIQPGQSIDLDVTDWESVHLEVRVPMGDGPGGVIAARVRLSVDDHVRATLPVIASRDPDAPDVTRPRAMVWPIPESASRLRVIAVDRPLWVRGALIRRKISAQSPSRATLLARLRAVRGDETTARPTLVAALAAAWLGDDALLARLSSDQAASAGTPLMQAFAAAAHAEATMNSALAERTALRLQPLAQAGGSGIERAVAHLLLLAMHRIVIDDAFAAGHIRAAYHRATSLFAAGSATDEDVALLGDIESLLPDGLVLTSHALAAVDGLLALRPLDRQLWLTRAHVYAVGTRWRHLGSNTPASDLGFFEPIPDGAAPIPARTTFSEIPPGIDGRQIDVPRPLQAHLRPVLSFVTTRDASADPGYRAVLLDGAVLVRLPALTALDRFDVTVEPGRHRLTLGDGDFGGQVLVNYAVAAATQQERRYVQSPGAELRVQMREVGPPSVAALTVRLLGPGAQAAPQRVDLTVTTGHARPVRFTVEATARQPPARGDVDAGRWVTAPVEMTVPLPAGTSEIVLAAKPPPGVRLLVNVAARERRGVFEEGSIDLSLFAGAGGALASPDSDLPRALMLAERDEVLLARETLTASFRDASTDDAHVAVLAALWRQIDDLQGASGTTASHAAISPALALIQSDAGGGATVLPERLRVVLDDAEVLTTASAASLRRRAGEGAAGDLAIIAAARVAETAADSQRAAMLWRALAVAHPDVPSVRRQAGLAILQSRPGSQRAAAAAYVELFAAAARDPSDSITARILHRANAQTRLRPLAFPEQSAGNFLVHAESNEEVERTVDWLCAARAAPSDGPSPDDGAALLTHGRDINLSFALPRSTGVRLNLFPVELRPYTAGATRPPPVVIEWSFDFRRAKRTTCAADRRCLTEVSNLGAGAHTLAARVLGGLRPAIWVQVHDDRHGESTSVPISAGIDYSVATPETAVRLKVRGPVLVKVEVRHPANDGHIARALFRASANGTTAAVTRELVLRGVADRRVETRGVGALTEAEQVFLPLPGDADYLVETRSKGGAVLARFSVREGIPDDASAASTSFAFVTPEPSTYPAPTDLFTAPTVVVHDGDLAPGWDDVGSVGVWSELTRESTNPEGAPVQVHSSLELGASYRRQIEALHTTVRVQASQRFYDEGEPGQTTSFETLFMHPRLEWLRLQTFGQGVTQRVLGQQAWSLEGGFMLEPVATLRPGLHLVSKLSPSWSVRAVPGLRSEQLSLVDPDLYSDYAKNHPRSLFWEEGLEMEPFLNMVLYGNARLTTNPSFSPLDPDHLSATVFVRTLFARTVVEVSERSTWFFADSLRPHLARHDAVFLRLLQTFWANERNEIEIAAIADYDFATRSPEALLSVTWEMSNGRRFQDHTPLEGEDFFFPQRGPGWGTSLARVAP
jgi:hypothetical protein